EYARTRLKSSWPSADVAAYTAVTSPPMSTTVDAIELTWRKTWHRTTRYTPAVTMVAAWISADTGVGPSMASGSHVCSGNCADLPAAPHNNSSAMTVTAPPLALPENTVAKSSAWNVVKIMAMLTRN